MHIGDEGGTTQSIPELFSPYGSGAQTTRATNRPSFTFANTDLAPTRCKEELTKEDRQKMKKELTQSLNPAEAKKQKAAAIRKKIQEDY